MDQTSKWCFPTLGQAGKRQKGGGGSNHPQVLGKIPLNPARSNSRSHLPRKGWTCSPEAALLDMSNISCDKQAPAAKVIVCLESKLPALIPDAGICVSWLTQAACPSCHCLPKLPPMSEPHTCRTRSCMPLGCVPAGLSLSHPAACSIGTPLWRSISHQHW